MGSLVVVVPRGNVKRLIHVLKVGRKWLSTAEVKATTGGCLYPRTGSSSSPVTKRNTCWRLTFPLWPPVLERIDTMYHFLRFKIIHTICTVLVVIILFCLFLKNTVCLRKIIEKLISWTDMKNVNYFKIDLKNVFKNVVKYLYKQILKY